MFGLSVGELIVILVIIVLLVGGRKLPELGSSLAKGIKNFKSELKDQDKGQDKDANQK